MSKMRVEPRQARRRLVWLFVAAYAAVQPACETAPANPAANNHLGGLSLTASLSGTTFELKYPPDSVELTVTLWNANTVSARVEAIQVVHGHKHLEYCSNGGASNYTKNDLRHARGLACLLRFADGAAAEVHLPSPRMINGSLCHDGHNWTYGPLEVPAGGTKSYTQRLNQVMADVTREPREMLGRCPRFCLTVVAEGAGLRSNTVFVNGEFPLPAGFDPIAELRALRRAETAAAEAERARWEAEVEADRQRILREAGAVRP